MPALTDSVIGLALCLQMSSVWSRKEAEASIQSSNHFTSALKKRFGWFPENWLNKDVDWKDQNRMKEAEMWLCPCLFHNRSHVLLRDYSKHRGCFHSNICRMTLLKPSWPLHWTPIQADWAWEGLRSSQTLLGFCWMVGKRSRQDRLFVFKNSKRLKRSSKGTFGPDYHKASLLNEGFLKFFQRNQWNPPNLIEPRWFRSFTEVIKKKPYKNSPTEKSCTNIGEFKV